MCKSSVYFGAPPLSANASSLSLLWQRHCAHLSTTHGGGVPHTTCCKQIGGEQITFLNW